MDLCTQALTPGKRAAQFKVIEIMRAKLALPFRATAQVVGPLWTQAESGRKP
jgi:hypothetical protein